MGHAVDRTAELLAAVEVLGVTKAGTSRLSGTSSGLAKPLPPEMRTKVAMSLSRVWCSMKVLSGPTALVNAVASAEDYARCAEITRQASSNFYYAFMLLPPERRRALYAVYAFCRFVDDIARPLAESPKKRSTASSSKSSPSGVEVPCALTY